MMENIGQHGSPRARRVRGFTLIELMVVFMIISLLVTILLPTINSMLATRANLRAKTRIARLANGAASYQKEHGFYPGQEYPGKVDGGGGTGESYSGSQILAAAMFGYDIESAGSVDNDINGTPEPTNKWVSYEAGILSTLGPDADKRPHTISDGFSNPMAICYYPSQMTGGNQVSQFDEDANIVYTAPPYQGPDATDDTFISRITHPRLGGAVNAGGVLLIAPGPDRLYFTKDDLKNW